MLRIVFLSAAFGIVVLFALTVAQYRHDILIARRRLRNWSRVVNTACGPIEYAEAGEGPAVLIIHGAGGGFDQGMLLGRQLIAAGMRVVAMSRFGYLRTPLPGDASPERQADAHACLMDALDIDKATVVAFSAGAPSAAQLAIRHPDRVNGLVLNVPAMYMPRPESAKPVNRAPGMNFVFETALKSNFAFWIAQRVAERALIRTILGTPPADLDELSEGERRRIIALLDAIQPISERRPGLMNEANVIPSLPRYDLESIRVPTLCISVANDGYGTFGPARYTAEHIPGGRFVGYARGGHMMAGHNDDWVKEVTRFVEAVAVQTAARNPRELAALT